MFWSIRETDDAVSDPLSIRVLGWLGARVLAALNATLRWKDHGAELLVENYLDQSPAIIAFWHGRQLMIPCADLKHSRIVGKRRVVALISAHRDGRLIARALKYFGVDSVAGSSTRGGKEATRGLVRELQAGNVVAITPDGPKGPIFKCKPGIVRLAQECQVPIYPMAYAADRKFTFNSWDKMILPKPFARVVWVVGAPIRIAPEADFESARALVETALNDITRRADELVVK